jgi:ribosomal protein S18 acetylase RimI-like enzyme
MVTYANDVSAVSPDQLHGFFEGWPDPPNPDRLLEILRHSSHVALALEGSMVVGFVNAISDGVLSAYIPLLEVRREYRRRGIGSRLVRLLLDELRGLYMIDLICDPQLQPFYERIGFQPATGAILRNYANQAGRMPAGDPQ